MICCNETGLVQASNQLWVMVDMISVLMDSWNTAQYDRLDSSSLILWLINYHSKSLNFSADKGEGFIWV